MFVSPKFCMSIVSTFSWDLKGSQEKTKTMLMQDLEGQTKSITIFLIVACRNNNFVKWIGMFRFNRTWSERRFHASSNLYCLTEYSSLAEIPKKPVTGVFGALGDKELDCTVKFDVGGVSTFWQFYSWCWLQVIFSMIFIARYCAWSFAWKSHATLSANQRFLN